MSSWSDETPDDRAWRPASGLSRAARQAEQDLAAGGAPERLIPIGDGAEAKASIELRRLPKSRRIYSYLRWYQSGRTQVRYIGEVAETDRAANLASAWTQVKECGLGTYACASGDRPTTVRKKAGSSWASSDAVRASMRGNKGRDTKPELMLRSAVHALGLRFRVNYRPIKSSRRTADIAFTKLKVAVFLDGCFWHGCAQHHRQAKTNADFWATKIEGNRTRDAETDRLLAAEGWVTLRVWEHEDPKAAADRVAEIVRSRRPLPSVRPSPSSP